MDNSGLDWDLGTAYDLWVSLDVLHRPTFFGVRGAWAAGMRARIPAAARETLDQAMLVFSVPLAWIHSLPEPKNTGSVLHAMEQIPAKDRLRTLTFTSFVPKEFQVILEDVAARGSWQKTDRDALQQAYLKVYPQKVKKEYPEEVGRTLDAWAHAEEFGAAYLEALQAYQDVFFSEEERRIYPSLVLALERAKDLAKRLVLPDLLEELSQGVRFADLTEGSGLVLAPSYWCTPFMYMGELADGRRIHLFGARPADDSLVPGEHVPDSLLLVLKALSDPTRLRMLCYLNQQPHSQVQLARKLRLRAPTVTHHLAVMRRAGLVHLALSKDKEAESYTTRMEAVDSIYATLISFLTQCNPTQKPDTGASQ